MERLRRPSPIRTRPAADHPPCRRTSPPRGPVARRPSTIAFKRADDRRMQRVIQVADVLVLAIGGQRVLDQIVGADAQEIGLLGQQVGDQGGAGRLDHGPERHVGIVGDPLARQLGAHLLADGLRHAQLGHARDQRKQDRIGPPTGGAEQRPQLRAEDVRCGATNSGWSATPAPGSGRCGMRTAAGILSPPRSSVRKVMVRPPTLFSAATACAYCSSSVGRSGRSR